MKKSLLMLASVLLIAGCTQTNVDTAPADTTVPTPSAEADTGPIKIGVIAPLAGGAAVYGEDGTNAYDYVIDRVNEAGGIDGRQVELIYENGGCGGKEATTAVQKLINIDGVKTILGGFCSAETIPAGTIAQQAGVTMISATSSSPEISSIGDYVFRYWNDLEAGTQMAEYLENGGTESIALVYENNDYSVAYADVIKGAFGGSIDMDAKVSTDEKDLSILAKQIGEIADDVDTVIFVAVTESLSKGVMQALDNEGVLENIADKLMGAEAVLIDGVLEAVGSNLDGVRTMVLSDEFGGTSADVIEEFKTMHEVGSAEVFVTLMIDSAEMLVEAIDEVGNDSDKVRDYIASFSAENPRSSIIGDFWFNEDGDGQGIEFVVKTAQGGELVLAE